MTRRILVVEDEPGIALALEDDLTREGYAVEVVSDGAVATRRAREAPFDLILLDVMLPTRDGFDVCRDLRTSGIHTPIIMLTARAQELDKVVGLDLGADDYVTKPYSPRELRARIKAALRRTGTDPPDVYTFGDVQVDFSRYELRRDGTVIELTALEFKLLSAFIRHQGRVLSRQHLLDAVWGHATFVTDRVVDNQVANLRKKIEPVSGEPRHIVSVRGAGYRFDG